MSKDLSRTAYDHLWMHFTRMSDYEKAPVPTIVRGEGTHIFDDQGKRYLDGLSGLFVVNAGHGRQELAEAAYKQAKELAFFPVWSYAHPKAVELAERLANYARATSTRSSSPRAAARPWRLPGSWPSSTSSSPASRPSTRSSRVRSPTTAPAGRPVHHRSARTEGPFEPLVPGAHKVPNTNIYRAPLFGDDPVAFGRWAADQIEQEILFEGADTVAAVFLEPVQNSGGCFPPPPGYFQRVREICDKYDVLLVSDEVICAFGRIGTMFACDKFDYVPDMITCAKGMTSGYSPIGACIISDRLAEPFYQGDNTFLHGYTFGGHPVSAAVGLANLDIFEREGLNQHVLDNENAFLTTLQKLHDLPIVGDVRGNGFFYGIELVKDKVTKETFTDEETERVLYGFLSKALYDNGLYCRADDRGDPVIQLAPPLISDQSTFDEIEGILRTVLTEAWTKL
ncbi:aspartate aminotransferase family protein [Streptomyces sp. M10(2022)]